uniref:Cell division coordinator CpoB n=1 Tax=Candidatus Methanogaster sp. ANME-2c ERB4 TaxID=2759911 RepID=A0A7G9Y5Q5_9EURY|nr:cell division coordinator CpoB [Methanosarcinales archaeon ANME-2c ERB4]
MMYTRQLKEFLNELRLAKGRNCLIFAIAANSEEFVEQAESYDLHVNEIHLNENINLLEVLSDWEETSEDTVYFVEGVRNQFPWILGYLNLHRDIFYEIKRPVVIFGSEYEITEITKYAPDLWRFRSRTYDFIDKKEIRGGFPSTLSEPSISVEKRLHYALPIFEEESVDAVRERITANNYLLEIIKEDYKRAELYMSLAISYLKLDDFERGNEYFERALEVRLKLNDNIGMSIDYRRFGDFYVFKGEYADAIRYYREAIRADPDYAAAHTNLGVLLYDLRRYDEAENEYKEAIRIDPDDAVVHYNLGVLLKELERHEEAEKEYIEAIRIDPNDAAVYNNFGNMLKDLKRYDEAEKEYREAIKIYPDLAAAHYNLGILLKDLERHDEAEEEYREAIRIDPDDVATHYNFGGLLKELERYDEAEKEYREAIRIDPDLAAAHYNLGNLLDDLERYDEAEEEYREAIRIDPDDGEAHANLGYLFLRIERPKEAKNEFEIAKELFEKQGREADLKKVEELLVDT